VSETTLSAEELARANLYGLIARLFYAAPDAALLEEMARMQAPEPESPLGRAWAELVGTWRGAAPEALEDEHTTLFIGTGKAEVTPYVSHYVLRHSTDEPLVELREQLLRWGIGRRPGAFEPEDHFSALCEVMRYAIAVQQRNLVEQRDFFRTFLYRGGVAFCDAVRDSEKANFYRPLALLARAFLEAENEAFALLPEELSRTTFR